MCAYIFYAHINPTVSCFDPRFYFGLTGFKGSPGSKLSDLTVLWQPHGWLLWRRGLRFKQQLVMEMFWSAGMLRNFCEAMSSIASFFWCFTTHRNGKFWDGLPQDYQHFMAGFWNHPHPHTVAVWHWVGWPIIWNLSVSRKQNVIIYHHLMPIIMGKMISGGQQWFLLAELNPLKDIHEA